MAGRRAERYDEALKLETVPSLLKMLRSLQAYLDVLQRLEAGMSEKALPLPATFARHRLLTQLLFLYDQKVRICSVHDEASEHAPYIESKLQHLKLAKQLKAMLEQADSAASVRRRPADQTRAFSQEIVFPQVTRHPGLGKNEPAPAAPTAPRKPSSVPLKKTSAPPPPLLNLSLLSRGSNQKR